MTITAEEQRGLQALIAFIERYGPPAGPHGPELMVREVFSAKPDEWQARVLADYGASAPGISIRSCHGPGKTTVLAWCIVHQQLTRFPQKVACTAPTGTQLYDALFAETKSWIGKLPAPLRGLLTIKSDRIELRTSPAESFTTFRTARADQPEAIQGVHAPWVLIIADEASGVPEPIFEAASGSMSGTHRTTILAGNPTRTSGTFFDSHHKLTRLWKVYHIYGDPAYASTFTSPNSYLSARVPASFVELMEARYGKESNAYRVRVLGEFPRSDLDTVIPYELVQAARVREVSENPYVRPIWGLDVAWRGDDLSALCKRRGNVVTEPVRVWHNADAMVLVGSIKAEYDAIRREGEHPAAICVDAINYGAAIASRLAELGLPARPINVAENPPITGNRYSNLRTELWYSAREWLARRDSSLPDDDELEADLVQVKYEIVESNGKMQIEPKKKSKARGVRSPDRGDAFVLTFAENATIAAGLGGGVFGKREPLRRNVRGIV